MWKLVVKNCATSMVAHWSGQNYFQTSKFYLLYSLSHSANKTVGLARAWFTLVTVPVEGLVNY